MARLPRAIHDEIVRQALEAPRTSDGLREEICGLIAAGPSGEPVRVYPIANVAGEDGRGSPYRYLMDGLQVMKAQNEVDDSGGRVWAVYHSHVASPARLSPTDLRAAFFPPGEFDADLIFPGAIYIVISLASDPPDVRGYRVQKGYKPNRDPVDPVEEPIEVVE